jgi:hypothetical protein
MLRLTTTNRNAHKGVEVSIPQAEESRGLEDLVPEEEGARKITSFWCPGEERTGEADCSSPPSQISQEILQLIHPAATAHPVNGIPMGPLVYFRFRRWKWAVGRRGEERGEERRGRG